MFDKKFTEDDRNKLVEFLNMVALNATLQLKTDSAIKYVKLLNYLQTQLLPKIESNIFEIKEVIKAKKQNKTES